jgi:hypothetical protein
MRNIKLIFICFFILTFLPVTYAQNNNCLKQGHRWIMSYQNNWLGNYYIKDSNTMNISVPGSDRQYQASYKISIFEHKAVRDTAFTIQIKNQPEFPELHFHFKQVSPSEFRLTGRILYFYNKERNEWTLSLQHNDKTLIFKKGQHFND